MEDKLSNFKPLHYMILTWAICQSFSTQVVSQKLGVLEIAYNKRLG